MVARTAFSVTRIVEVTPPDCHERKILLVRHSYVWQGFLIGMAVCVLTAFAPSRALANMPLPAAEKLISQVETRYNPLRTLSVGFTETYSLLGHGRPPESGMLTLRKSGRMRWDYRQPPGKLFVSDGKTIFLYTARDNRVEKVPLKTTEDMRAPLAFLLGKLDFKKEFRDITTRPSPVGSSPGSQASGHQAWLVAQAKSERMPYRSIEMLIGEAGQINELVILGRDESVTTYRFENEKLNPPVDEALFHFQIPPGAEVVDALEVRSGDDR